MSSYYLLAVYPDSQQFLSRISVCLKLGLHCMVFILTEIVKELVVEVVEIGGVGTNSMTCAQVLVAAFVPLQPDIIQSYRNPMTNKNHVSVRKFLLKS